MGYASVVVGTDGSTTAEQAVRTAAELAGAAPLVVVTAFGPGPDGGPAVPAPERSDDRGDERGAAEELAELAAAEQECCSFVTWSVTVEDGAPTLHVDAPQDRPDAVAPVAAMFGDPPVSG